MCFILAFAFRLSRLSEYYAYEKIREFWQKKKNTLLILEILRN